MNESAPAIGANASPDSFRPPFPKPNQRPAVVSPKWAHDQRNGTTKIAAAKPLRLAIPLTSSSVSDCPSSSPATPSISSSSATSSAYAPQEPHRCVDSSPPPSPASPMPSPRFPTVTSHATVSHVG